MAPPLLQTKLHFVLQLLTTLHATHLASTHTDTYARWEPKIRRCESEDDYRAPLPENLALLTR